jgi:hypothetical protein
LIRQTRENYDGIGAKKLPALTFAGMIITGGIVGYDTIVSILVVLVRDISALVVAENLVGIQ